MDGQGLDYIVGARIKRLGITEKILDKDAYKPLAGEILSAEWEHRGRRLVVSWSPIRARKDAHDRQNALAKLIKKLERSDNPKELLSNHGNKRFIAGRARLDEDKIRDGGTDCKASSPTSVTCRIGNCSHVTVISGR